MTRIKIHDFEILLRELRLGKRIERIPLLVASVAVLVDPEGFALVDLLRDGGVDEPDLLGSEVGCDVP